MNIDIHITGATPTEAQRVFSALGTGSPVRKRRGSQTTAGNFSNEEWDDEEKDTIRNCPDKQAAVQAHRAKYPQVKRTTAAIKRMLQKLQKQPTSGQPSLLPQPEPEQPAIDKPADSLPARPTHKDPSEPASDGARKGMRVLGGAKCSKSGIPAGLSTSDPRKYARLIYRITKGGMTYEEALAREDAVKEAKEPARTLDTISPNTIVTGMHVRQIRPDQGRQIFGTAVVLARVGDIIEVRNGGGKKHKIDARCLEVVPAGEASDRATGASS